MTRAREYRYAVMGVDLAGVPWEIARSCTPAAALSAVEAQGRARGFHSYAYDTDDPERGSLNEDDLEPVRARDLSGSPASAWQAHADSVAALRGES